MAPARSRGAARRAIEHPGKVFKAHRFRFKREGAFLLLALCSGRKLAYYQPAINLEGRFGPEITTMGRDYTSRWERIATHAGKLCENLIQAIARDLLLEGLFHAEATPGLEVVGHVHDEILALADAHDDAALDRLTHAMGQMPAWAADAPVRARIEAELFSHRTDDSFAPEAPAPDCDTADRSNY